MAGRIVFAAAFCLFALSASPAMGWLDSPEFVAASASLGVAHSPGHPLPLLLGRLVGYLPIGDLTFRVNAASCLLAALAATALFAAGRGLLDRLAPSLEDGPRDLLAGAAALAFAFGWASWYQAVRAEVYALQSLLVIGALASLIAWDHRREGRWLLVAGLLGGLGLANHHLIALTILIPGALFVLIRPADQRPPVRVAAACAVVGVIGLAALLYLPVRSLDHPEVNWGAPHTFERFTWTVSAKAFQKSVGTATDADEPDPGAPIAMALIENVSFPLFLLALIGAYLGLRRPGWRRLALFLLGTAALSAGARALIGFRPGIPDHHAYLVPAVASLVLLALAGAAVIIETIGHNRPSAGRITTGVLGALAVAAVIMQLLLHGPTSNLEDARASDRVAAWELEGLPPRSILLVTYFETSFRLAALRATEQSRPDIAILDLGFLTHPGTAEETIRRHPELEPIVRAPLRLGRPLPVDRLRATGRPVFVQLQPKLDPPALRELVPLGPYAHLPRQTPTAAERRTAEQADNDWRDWLGRALRDPGEADWRGVRDHLLWHDFNRLRYYCRAVEPSAWEPPVGGLLDGDCALTTLPGEPSPPAEH